MPPRVGWFMFGVVTALVVLIGGAYLFVKGGGVSMETTARPLPLEKAVARAALRASLGNAADQKNPVPFGDVNMLAGAREYKRHCAVCHGAPRQPRTAISRGLFPPPRSSSRRTKW